MSETGNSNVSGQQSKEEDFLNNMRGWLLTAAALFVSMAFQAAMQPPVWMPKTEIWSLLFGFSLKHPRSKNLSPEEKRLATAAANYQVSNALVFSLALTLTTLLVTMTKDKAARVMSYVKYITPIISLLVAYTFATGITDDTMAWVTIVLLMVAYAFITLCWFFYVELVGMIRKLFKRDLLHTDEVSRHDHPQIIGLTQRGQRRRPPVNT